MKKTLYLIVVLLLTAGCHEDDLPTSEVVGEWKLIQSHHYVGSTIIKEGDDLEWQEVYVFRSDGTFDKKRTSHAGSVTASGTYTTEDAPLYLSRLVTLLVKLTFTTGLNLAEGCSPGSEEIDFSSHDGMLRNHSIGCENPILTYERK